MKKTRIITISVNQDDDKVLQRLQTKLAGIGTTAVIRLALRALDKQTAK